MDLIQDLPAMQKVGMNSVKKISGLLWEQCILNELHAHLQSQSIHYWRDKQGKEIDFIIQNKKKNELTVIECKFSTLSQGKEMIDSIGTNVEAFRAHYPQGKNYVVASDITHAYERKYKDIILHFISAQELIKELLH